MSFFSARAVFWRSGHLGTDLRPEPVQPQRLVRVKPFPSEKDQIGLEVGALTGPNRRSKSSCNCISHSCPIT